MFRPLSNDKNAKHKVFGNRAHYHILCRYRWHLFIFVYRSSLSRQRKVNDWMVYILYLIVHLSLYLQLLAILHMPHSLFYDISTWLWKNCQSVTSLLLLNIEYLALRLAPVLLCVEYFVDILGDMYNCVRVWGSFWIFLGSRCTWIKTSKKKRENSKEKTSKMY